MTNEFTVGNYKTLKGEAKGYSTIILHLLPADQAWDGHSVCPCSTPQCRELCLVTAGRGVFKSVYDARLRRTKEFFTFGLERYARKLAYEVEYWDRHAQKKHLKLAVRINGTSDLPALARRVEAASFSTGRFYDYTKVLRAIPLRNKGPIHYTFSRSESNEAECITALAYGCNVAVVFSTKKGENLPKTYRLGGVLPVDVIDGDVNDLRFLDPRGVVVGLRAKGRARYHQGGFVVRV
jgi:hypothetical protein